MSNNVSFFSTVYDLRKPQIYFYAERYLNIAGRTGVVADIGPTARSALLREIDRKTFPLKKTALKITSMVLTLGILPLIALIIKIKGRYFPTHPCVYQWSPNLPKVETEEMYKTAAFLGLNKAILTSCENIIRELETKNPQALTNVEKKTLMAAQEKALDTRQGMAKFPEFTKLYPLGFA